MQSMLHSIIRKRVARLFFQQFRKTLIADNEIILLICTYVFTDSRFAAGQPAIQGWLLHRRMAALYCFVAYYHFGGMAYKQAQITFFLSHCHQPANLA